VIWTLSSDRGFFIYVKTLDWGKSEMNRVLAICVIGVFLAICGSAYAELVTFSDWSSTPQTNGDVTYTLLEYTDAFSETDGLNIFTNSLGNPQMNSWIFKVPFNGGSFTYRIDIDAPNYIFDFVSMSYSPTDSAMTTTVTAGSSNLTLTQPGNPLEYLGDAYTSLTVTNNFASGQITPGGFTNAFKLEQVPVPGAVWLLTSGLLGLVGLRKKIKN
jgi:hypothetical protein